MKRATPSHMRRRYWQPPWGRPAKRRMRNTYWSDHVANPYRKTAYSQATTAMKMIRKLKKQQEIKIASSTTGEIIIPIGGAWIVEGFGPYTTRGSDVADRIGRAITVQSLAMRCLVRLSALEAIGTSIRLCVFYDRRPAGADATAANVMADAAELMSYYNPTNTVRGRFQILYDKTFAIHPQNTQKPVKMFFKGPMKVEYNANNNGDVTDLSKGNFIIMAKAEANVAVIDVDYSFIFRFTDD